jgi:hypothetical protein
VVSGTSLRMMMQRLWLGRTFSPISSTCTMGEAETTHRNISNLLVPFQIMTQWGLFALIWVSLLPKPGSWHTYPKVLENPHSTLTWIMCLTYLMLLPWITTMTVPSESIHTPRLFPHFVVLQPEFKIDEIQIVCHWPTHTHTYTTHTMMCKVPQLSSEFQAQIQPKHQGGFQMPQKGTYW